MFLFPLHKNKSVPQSRFISLVYPCKCNVTEKQNSDTSSVTETHFVEEENILTSVRASNTRLKLDRNVSFQDHTPRFSCCWLP